MPKYLMKASFRPEAIRGVLKEGGTAWRTAVEQSAASGWDGSGNRCVTTGRHESSRHAF